MNKSVLEQKQDFAVMSFGGILVYSFRLWFSHWWLFFFIAFIVEIPIWFAHNAISQQLQSFNGWLTFLLNIIPTSLITPLGKVAATVAVLDHFNGERPSVRRSYTPVIKRFFPLLLALAVWLVLVLVGSLLLVIPAIVVLTFGQFIGQATVIEQRTLKDALVRSYELVRNGFWLVLGIFVSVEVINMVASSLLSEAFSWLIHVLPMGIQPSLSLIWDAFINVALAPCVYVPLAILYIVRREASSQNKSPMLNA